MSFLGRRLPERVKDLFLPCRPCGERGAIFHMGGEIQMPSNAILEQKAKVVADLAALIKASASGVIVNYQGITVEKDTAMRKALREAGVK